MGVYKAETTCSDDHRVTGRLMSMFLVPYIHERVYESIQGRDYLLRWTTGHSMSMLVVLYRHVYKAETTCSDYHRVTGHSMSMLLVPYIHVWEYTRQR